MSKRDTEGFGTAPHERPVPRISIHGFCEFPDSGAALQRAGADRRLSKAHLTVQLGGIAAAVEHYRGQMTPNLLIVETRLHGQAALAELDRLAEVCDSATKVVVVGRTYDVHLIRNLRASRVDVDPDDLMWWRKSPMMPGLGWGLLRFDYGERAVTIRPDLEPSEATNLANYLNRYLPFGIP